MDPLFEKEVHEIRVISNITCVGREIEWQPKLLPKEVHFPPAVEAFLKSWIVRNFSVRQNTPIQSQVWPFLMKEHGSRDILGLCETECEGCVRNSGRILCYMAFLSAELFQDVEATGNHIDAVETDILTDRFGMLSALDDTDKVDERILKPRALVFPGAAAVSSSVLDYVNASPLGDLTKWACYLGDDDEVTAQHRTCGVDIVVSTPARVVDMVAEKILDLRLVEFLVVDGLDLLCDADESLHPKSSIASEIEAPYQNQIDLLVQLSSDIVSIRSARPNSPPRHTTLLFSERFDADLAYWANTLLVPDHVTVEVGEVVNTITHPEIQQNVLIIPHELKRQTVRDLLSGKTDPDVDKNKHRMMIICEEKRFAVSLDKALQRDGIHCVCYHEDKSEREKIALRRQWRGNQCPFNIIVTTSDASAMLDAGMLDAIVNFDMPKRIHEYVRRSRMLAKGPHAFAHMYTFFCKEDHHIAGPLCDLLRSNDIIPGELVRMAAQSNHVSLVELPSKVMKDHSQWPSLGSPPRGQSAAQNSGGSTAWSSPPHAPKLATAPRASPPPGTGLSMTLQEYEALESDDDDFDDY